MEEVGVEGDDGAEGEFEVKLEVWVGGGEVCWGEGRCVALGIEISRDFGCGNQRLDSQADG